eukprot:17048-Prymnesium_polylepis.3
MRMIVSAVTRSFEPSTIAMGKAARRKRQTSRGSDMVSLPRVDQPGLWPCAARRRARPCRSGQGELVLTRPRGKVYRKPSEVWDTSTPEDAGPAARLPKLRDKRLPTGASRPQTASARAGPQFGNTHTARADHRVIERAMDVTETAS